MAEAEDVMLYAAEQVTAAAGALWRRHRPAEEPSGIALADVSRRLSMLIQACLGRVWPLLPVDPEAAPTWLARQLRKLPPWLPDRCAQAFSDGMHIFLPRHLEIFAAPSDADLLRLMALMLTARGDFPLRIIGAFRRLKRTEGMVPTSPILKMHGCHRIQASWGPAHRMEPCC